MVPRRPRGTGLSLVIALLFLDPVGSSLGSDRAFPHSRCTLLGSPRSPELAAGSLQIRACLRLRGAYRVYDSTTGIDEESSDDGIQGLCGPDGELVGPDESIETLEEYSFPISGGVRDSSEDSEVLVGKKRQLDEKKKDPLEIARDTLMEVCMTTEEARIEQELRNKLNRHLAKTIDEQRGDPEAVGLQTPFRPMPPGRRALLQRLMDAAREGNVPALQAALADGADVDARSLTNATSLHAAALGGHVEAMRVLLAAGADPNARDEFNQSTLHLAAQSGSIPAVRLLVEDAGAALTLVSVIGDTARDAAHFEALMHEDHADNITHFRDPTRAAALRSVEAYLAGKGCGFLDPRVPPDERMRRAAEHWDPDRTGYFFEGHSILDDPGFLRRPEIRQRVGESDAMHRARVLAVRQGVAASKAKEQRREALRRNKAALEKFKPNDKVFDTAGLVLPRPARPDGAPWRDALGRTQEEYDRDYDPDESGNEYGERIHRRNTSLEWDESWRWTEARERKLREALARQERAWDEALAKRLDDSTSSLSVDDPPPDPNKMHYPDGWDEGRWIETALAHQDADLDDQKAYGWTDDETARRTVRRPPPLSEMPRPGTPDPEYEAVLEAELDWAEAYFGERPISAFELADHPELADRSESNPDAASAEDGAERLVLESDA